MGQPVEKQPEKAVQIKLQRRFPPCNVEPLLKMPKSTEGRQIIMSFAQFRPEKNQQMQVDVYKEVCKRIKDRGVKDRPLFYMVGSLRGADDERILKGIENKVRENNLQVTNNLFHRKM